MALGPGSASSSGSAFSGQGDPQLLDQSRAYPHQFFSISDKYIPNTMKELFRWAMYIYSTNGSVNQTIRKMAGYVTTDLVYNSEDEKSVDNWKSVLRTIEYQRFEKLMLLDYFTYGNAFARFMYPKQRMLACPKCKHADPIDNHDYKFASFRFQSVCNKCGYSGPMDAYDRPTRNKAKLKLIRIDPRYIQPIHEPVSGSTEYLYSIPRALANRIREGSKNRASLRVILDNVPLEIITAVEKGHLIKFPKDTIYHFKWDSVSRDDNSLGEIPFLAIFKTVWLYNTLWRAQEAVSLEHVLPWLMVSPASTGGGVDPISNFNMESWTSFMKEAIPRWRRDPNFVGIAPFPVNAVQLRGDAKGLDNWQGLEHLRASIAGGMGIPESFLYGGSQYSAASVELRVLENEFRNIVTQLDTFLEDFTIPKLIRYFRFKRIDIHHQQFKMADDVQQRSMMLQLHQSGVASEQRVATEFGLNYAQERKLITMELEERAKLQRRVQLADAEVQAEIQVIMAKAQARAQQIMQTGGTDESDHEPEVKPFGNQGQTFTTNPEALRMQAQMFLKTRTPMMQERELQQISQTNPAYAKAIQAEVERLKAKPSAAPLPAQLPSRAGPAKAQL